MKIKDRITHAWNAFTRNDHMQIMNAGYSSSRPTHKTINYYTMSSYVSSIYNRIAIDVSMTTFKHVKVNPINEDVEDVKSSLNECLSVEANIDQTHMQFIHDLVYSMFDEGVVAVVPVETTTQPVGAGAYDINSLRVGKIITWYPKHVEVELYNENTGQNERIVLEKKHVAIVENPLYSVVNSENSTLKRLIKNLNQLDAMDSENTVGRLDLLISVPYGVKTDTQKAMANARIKSIEEQLSKGKNGIAYIDATEKVTQLNRPLDSQLPQRVQELSQQFHNQIGMTQNIFNGTASESEQRTYYTRTIDPIAEAIVTEFTRKFITKTARTQGQKIVYYRDMFKTVPVEVIANLGDAFRRNSIASSNELRKLIGLRHSNDPRADELFNPNIADKNQNTSPNNPTENVDSSE